MRGREAAPFAWVAACGLLAVAAYLAAASSTLGSGRLPLRPFFDGTAPPAPYRWVNPPADLKAGNQPPLPGNGTVTLGAKGSEQATVPTDDGQALVVFYQGSIRARAGETQATVTIEPLDPAKIGPPPEGVRYDGNAYRMSATYAKSGAPAEFGADSCPAEQQPKLCPTIVLRSALGARGLYIRDGSAWTKVVATPAPASQQIFGESPALGTFVAAGSPLPGRSRTGDYVAIGLGGTAVVGGILVTRSRAVRSRWRRWRKNRQLAARRKASAARRPLGPPKKRKPPGKTHGRQKRKR